MASLRARMETRSPIVTSHAEKLIHHQKEFKFLIGGAIVSSDLHTYTTANWIFFSEAQFLRCGHPPLIMMAKIVVNSTSYSMTPQTTLARSVLKWHLNPLSICHISQIGSAAVCYTSIIYLFLFRKKARDMRQAFVYYYYETTLKL